MLAISWHPSQFFHVFYPDVVIVINNRNFFIFIHGVDLTEILLPCFYLIIDNIRRDSVKKNDDALADHKDVVYYFSALVIDCLTVVLPILLIFTASTLFIAF